MPCQLMCQGRHGVHWAPRPPFPFLTCTGLNATTQICTSPWKTPSAQGVGPGGGGLGLSTFPRPSCFRFQPITPHRTEGSLWLHWPTLSHNAGLGPGCRGAIHPTAAPTAALGCTQCPHPWGISEQEFTTSPVLEPHRCPSTAISAAAGCLVCGRTASPALFTGPPHEAPTCTPCSQTSSLQDGETMNCHLSCSSVASISVTLSCLL